MKIPAHQRQLHIAAELAALTVVAPVAAYIAYSNPTLPRWQRAFLWSVAVGTLVIDGALLAHWLRK